MTKVLRIINRFNLGGPTYNVAYLAKYMAPEYETILAGGEKDTSEASSDYIVKQLDLHPVVIAEMRRSINPFNDYKAYKKIKALIKEHRPDIVHTHASKSGALGRLAAFHCKVPVIVHTFHGHIFHSYFNPLVTGVFKIIERYLANRSHAIIAISELQKQELVNEHHICSEEKVHVIPLGFDLERFYTNIHHKRTEFRKAWNIEANELVVMIIGRLVPIKNHELFLRGVAQVKQKCGVAFRAVIVGDGESRGSLEKICEELQLSYSGSGAARTEVLFTSWIREADVALAGADIVCLTSWNEGTPVSLIEAQAAGKPIVTTAVGGVENVVIPNETAFCVTPGDTNQFSAQLEKLVVSSDLRARLAMKGREHVMKKFHYTRLVNDMKSLYERLLSHRKR